MLFSLVGYNVNIIFNSFPVHHTGLRQVDINDLAQLRTAVLIIQHIMTSTQLSLVSKDYNDLHTAPEQSLTTTPKPIRFPEKEIRFK